MGNGTVILDERVEATPDSQVLEQLERLLASSQLRNSKRHHRLLTFLITSSLRGEDAEIKERLLGIEVFGRPPDYDVSNDTIVRGAIADLRKRLALYYAEAKHSGELHFEIPLGGYVPKIYWPSAPAGLQDGSYETTPLLRPVSPEAHDATLSSSRASSRLKSPRGKILFWGGSLIVISVVAFIAWYFSPAQRADRNFDAFWSPLTEGPGSVLICVGSLNHIMLQPPVENDTWTHVTLTRNHVDPNAGAALMNVAWVLGAKGKKVKFGIADSITLADLRAQRSVYIGGHSNQWAMRLQSALRFRIENANGVSAIIDTKSPEHPIATFSGNERVSNISHDYGLITRAIDPLTGEPVIALSGLGSYGTFTASEFASEPKSVETAIKRFPNGWEHRTQQIVVEADVVDGKASPPQIVAVDIR